MAVHLTRRNLHDDEGNVKKCLGGIFMLRSGLAERISDTATFEPELTEDGVLFRYIGETPRTRARKSDKDSETPGWVTGGKE